MRVCLVSRELSPLTGGGIGVYIAEMARALLRAGHEAHILTEAHGGLEREGARACPGARFHAVDLCGGEAARDAYPAFAMRHAMAVMESLRRLHGATPFDYIEFPDYHAEGYFAIAAHRTLGAFAGAVLGVRLHSPLGLCREADGAWPLDRDIAYTEHMELAAAAGADVIVSPGRRVLAQVLGACRDSGLEPTGRTEVLALPVDVDRLRDEMGRGPAERAASGRPVVLNIGRLQHLKGVQVLAAAAAAMLDAGSGAEFRFIGSDTATGPFGRSMLAFLRSRVPARWADRITFGPARARADLGAAVRGAAVCCFPSLWDAFPMACLEAMGAGAPVVASDAGGLGEMIEDGVSGVLCPPGDAGALAAALTRVLGDAGLRARLSAAGPERVRALCEPARVVRGLEEIVGAAGTRAGAVPAPVMAPRNGPEVSVVVPFFNLGRFLPETLESVRRQTFGDYELIVIDDGSTDAESLALLDRLGGDVRLIRQSNRGLSATRNVGLREARGRWIVALDADDLLAPDYLEKTVGAMRRQPGPAVVTTLVSTFVDDPAAPIGGWVPLGLDRDLLAVFNVGAAAGALIDRQAALSAGGYDESLTSYEDWEFWCRVAERGATAVVIPEFLFHYRVRPDSMFRTEALMRDLALRSYILHRHPGLPRRPERVMRMLAAAAGTPAEAEERARRICRENLRYRIADRVNGALKMLRVQGALKGIAGGLAGRANGRR